MTILACNDKTRSHCLAIFAGCFHHGFAHFSAIAPFFDINILDGTAIGLDLLQDELALLVSLYKIDKIAIRAESGWSGLYFGGVAFKKQRPVAEADYAAAAAIAARHMDVVMTSGVATGHEADTGKIATFRGAIGDAPLGLASGITPENADSYCADVNSFLVATGVNHPNDFYNIDPARLAALLDVTRAYGENHD